MTESSHAPARGAEPLAGDLCDPLRGAWHRFLDRVEPLRPGLHAYCRRLTGSVFDAEDLVQETLLRAFGRLAQLEREVRSPRAYLLRTATHLWIDRLRRLDTERQHEPDAPSAPAAAPEAGRALHEAGSRLLEHLAPRERAALALKEGFDLPLEEVAGILGTSTGAVKAALHRGRARLAALERTGKAEPAAGAPAPAASSVPTALVDRFVELFRAGDLAGLAGLLQENASVEIVGSSLQEDPESLAREGGWLYHLLHGHVEWPAPWRYEAQRLERAELACEPVLLLFRTRRGREKLEEVLRLEAEEGRIARIRDYGFCPEVTREAGRLLGLPVRAGPYRYPTRAPGESWPRGG